MAALLQERLARRALKDLDVKVDRLVVDHLEGGVRVDDTDLELIYPLSWVVKSLRLIQPKIYRYSFVGLVGDDRRGALEPYRSREDSLIIDTRYQRLAILKGHFNKKYWGVLHRTEFTLCPQRADWPGSAERAWTYRFIESVLAFSIPVVFPSLPLGKHFVRDFHYIEASTADEVPWSPEIAQHNFGVAVSRFVLPDALMAKKRSGVDCN